MKILLYTLMGPELADQFGLSELPMECETRVASEGQHNLGRPWRVTEPTWDIISLAYNYVFLSLCIDTCSQRLHAIHPPPKKNYLWTSLCTYAQFLSSFFLFLTSLSTTGPILGAGVSDAGDFSLWRSSTSSVSSVCTIADRVSLLVSLARFRCTRERVLSVVSVCASLPSDMLLSVTGFTWSTCSPSTMLVPSVSLVSSRWWSVGILSAISWDLQEHHQEVQTIGNDEKILIWVFQWSYLRILFAIMHNQNLYAVQLPFVLTQKHRDRCAVWKERGLTAR